MYILMLQKWNIQYKEIRLLNKIMYYISQITKFVTGYCLIFKYENET